MNQASVRYLSPPAGGFWRWKPQESLAVWSADDAWLAHRDEISALLSSLAPTGLPPLGAVLLVLAASRPDWSSVAAYPRLAGDPVLAAVVRPHWPRVAQGLDQLRTLPADLTRDLAVRCHLAQTLFGEIFGRLPAGVSQIIADDYYREHGAFLAMSPPEGDPAHQLQRDMNALREAFDRLDFSTLERRLRTGLAADVQPPADCPPPAVPPPVEAGEDLLAELRREGGELATVARLAGQLRAVLHLPRPLSPGNDLPLGGVSDIANRGDPDRLLISELAWDDLTFASRLAHHEALYLRREAPPTDPPTGRILILDTTVRLWGVPRLMTIATLLALQPQGKARAISPAPLVLALIDRTLKPVPIGNVEDVRKLLTVLEPGLFPLHVLAHWIEPFLPTDEGQTDVLFLTHAATAAEPETAAQLLRIARGRQQSRSRITPYVLSVERPDHLVLHLQTDKGSRIVGEAQLDVEKALTPEKSGNRIRRQPLVNAGADLPAYYQERPEPLYFPETPRPGHVFTTAPVPGRPGEPGEPAWIVGLNTRQMLMAWPWPLGVKPGRHLACEAAATGKLVDADASPDLEIIGTLWAHPGERLRLIIMNASGTILGDVEDELAGCRTHSPTVAVQGKSVIVRSAARAVAFGVGEGSIVHQWTWPNAGPQGSNLRYDESLGFSTDAPFWNRPSHVVRPIFKGCCTTIRPVRGIAIRGESVILICGQARGLSLKIYEGQLVLSEHHAPIEPAEVQTFEQLAPAQGKPLLSRACWPDGRVAWHDSRGVVHLSSRQPTSTASPAAETLSILLVKGATVAWCASRRRYYGNGSLLWGEPVQPLPELKLLLLHFCQP